MSAIKKAEAVEKAWEARIFAYKYYFWRQEKGSTPIKAQRLQSFTTSSKVDYRVFSAQIGLRANVHFTLLFQVLLRFYFQYMSTFIIPI